MREIAPPSAQATYVHSALPAAEATAAGERKTPAPTTIATASIAM
jgi:hypothetical protein